MKIKWGIESVKDFSDVLLKWASLLAIILGGWWTIHTFNVFASDTDAMQVDVGVRFLPHSEKNDLMVVDVKSKNMGKVPVNIAAGGLVLTVRPVARSAAAGAIDTAKLPVLYSRDLAKQYDGYEVDPGVEFDEVQAFIVPKGGIYFAGAEFDMGKDGHGIDNIVNGGAFAEN